MKFIQNNLLGTFVFSKKMGLRFFLIGTFLLPSAPAISVFFLLPSIISSILKNKSKYLKDFWNYPLIITSLLMVFSSLLAVFKNYDSKYLINPDPNISLSIWIDLLNWIPFFLCFWFIQPYLTSKDNRRLCAFALISGSIPVLISGFGQYWFNWHGPLDIFNGLIIWYQRPIANEGGLTGLFNNPNYAGGLLTMVLPFALASIAQKKLNPIKFLIILLINISIIAAIILTNSRNAWLGLIICLGIMLGSKRIILALFSAISAIVISSTLFESPLNLIQLIAPSKVINNFNLNILISDPRVDIWKNAIIYISEKPFFGFGGSVFPMLEIATKRCAPGLECMQHSHNIPLELAINYGIPTALILSVSVLILIFLGLKKIYKKDSIKRRFLEQDLFDKAWVTASLIMLISHLFDIQYFDIRIRFVCWVLLAGVKALISEKDNILFNKFKF